MTVVYLKWKYHPAEQATSGPTNLDFSINIVDVYLLIGLEYLHPLFRGQQVIFWGHDSLWVYQQHIFQPQHVNVNQDSQTVYISEDKAMQAWV